MAPPARPLFGWSWWPLRWPACLLLLSLLMALTLNILFIHPDALAAFTAMLIASPYAIIFLVGFPWPQSFSYKRKA
jgi:hypothetical protein